MMGWTQWTDRVFYLAKVVDVLETGLLLCEFVKFEDQIECAPGDLYE
jgi:hypothetical protein